MADNEKSNSTQPGDWNYYNWCTDYPSWSTVWSAIAVICFLLGFPASLWVLHELIQRQRQRSRSDIFMLSLSVMDLTFTIQIPYGATNFMLWHIKELEAFLDFIYSLSLFGRPLLMACICWDCYVAVIYPIMYKTSKKLILVRKALTITTCLITFGLGLVVSINAWLATTPFMGICLFLALPIITFCDISILRALRKPDRPGNSKIHPQKKQALNTISTSFVMTFIVYLPPGIIFSFGQLVPLKKIELYCCVNISAFCFSMAGCVIMPVLYLITVGKLDCFKTCWKKSSAVHRV